MSVRLCNRDKRKSQLSRRSIIKGEIQPVARAGSQVQSWCKSGERGRRRRWFGHVLSGREQACPLLLLLSFHRKGQRQGHITRGPLAGNFIHWQVWPILSSRETPLDLGGIRRRARGGQQGLTEFLLLEDSHSKEWTYNIL